MDDCDPFQGPSQNAMLEIIRDHAAPCERRDAVARYIGLDLDPGDYELPA